MGGTKAAARKPRAAAEKSAPTAKAKGKPASGKRAASKLVAEKPKATREKVVRDSFSMPKSEHAGLKSLRTDLARAGRICTKSELLRAGLQLVSARSIDSLVKVLNSLPVVPKGKGSKK